MKYISTIFTLFIFTSSFADLIHVPGTQPTIQDGINIASDSDTILVANGTYIENINFKGKAITVASHFLVDEDTSHINNTIIDGSQPNSPDSGSVVYFISGEDTNSVLYGFTIQNGSGTVIPAYNERSGGGIYMFPSGGRISRNNIMNNSITTTSSYITGVGILAAPVVKCVIIEHNNIHSNTGTIEINGNCAGGGIGIIGNVGESRILNNKIYNNTIITLGSGGTIGGGIFCGDETSGISLVKDNLIKENICQPAQTHSQNGGAGIRFYNMSGKLINNKIMNNSFIGNRGGGGGVLVSTASSVEIINNIIFGNFANRGGAIYNSGTVDIISNSISMNKSMSAGGGIYSTNPIPIIMNTIFWSDSTGNNLNEIFLVSGGSTPVAYSNIDSSGVVGSWNSINNIDADPLFADSLFHLSASSLCIGAGIDSIQIGGTWYYCPPYDIYGNPRPAPPDSLPDIGACESPRGVPTGIKQLDNIMLATYHLIQNYPNPFNPSTTIEFDLPKSSEVTLKVFNILGEEVAALVSDRLSAGSYSYEWSRPAGIASGVYLYRLQAGDYVETRKMVLMR